MSELSNVSQTLFVPLAGRLYASQKHPDILFDERVLGIADSIPDAAQKDRGQDEYTYLASAVRSRNMDTYIQAFLREYPAAAIVNVGCGLETLYDRNDNGTASWFELDLPDVLKLRQSLFPEQGRDHFLPYTMFDPLWIEEVKTITHQPALVIASGLFHYLSEELVIDFIRLLRAFSQVRIVFDTVSSTGLKITKRIMEKLGREDASMYFSIDDAKSFARKISDEAVVLRSWSFYGKVALARRLKVSTRLTMVMSDLLNMVKVVYLMIR